MTIHLTLKERIFGRISFGFFCSLCWFALLIHLLTRSGAQLPDFAAAFVVCMIMALQAVLSRRGDKGSFHADLAAMALGFWCFCFFRYLGLVTWPMGSAAGLSEHLHLLYSHLVLAVSVVAPLMAVRAMRGESVKHSSSPACRGRRVFFYLTLTALIFCGCAGWRVFSSGAEISSLSAGFLVICLLKAALTGVTEEFCYRGVLLRDCESFCGTKGAIGVQAVLYMLFHMHLGAAFCSPPLFLTGVLALGIILGIVTWQTRGIGWAAVVHTAVGLVIEWENLNVG